VCRSKKIHPKSFNKKNIHLSLGIPLGLQHLKKIERKLSIKKGLVADALSALALLQ
jgi:hypothetical protein